MNFKLLIAHCSLLIAHCLLPVALYPQFTNILIDNENNPNEPSIMFDPSNPQIVVAGSNISNIYFSEDGGYKWQKSDLSSKYGVWGDPCLIVDTSGSFYYFHLSNPSAGSWIDRIVCQRLDKPYNVWTEGTFTGLNGQKVQDKEWAVVDRTNNNIYVTWTQFDKYESLNPSDVTIILFSKSTDKGQTWSNPVRLSQFTGDCLDGDNTAEGAVPCVGTNGEIYVSWSNSGVIYFDKSTDQGETWLEKDIVVANQPEGWDLIIPGIYRANGLPVTVCDNSNGLNRGTIYICWADQRNGLTDSDVWISKSKDSGLSWSAPKKVNNDSTNTQQFFPWIAIDQKTGYIYTVFYDRRNYNDNRTDVYIAYSTDGGENFINQVISNTPFYPDPFVFFGDYTNIVADNGTIIPIWARMDNSTNSIWNSVIKMYTDIYPIHFANSSLIDAHIYPNPVNNIINLEINVNYPDKYNISLYNMMNENISDNINGILLNKGKHNLQFKIHNEHFNNGIYFISLSNSREIIRKKLFVLK